MNLNVVDFIKQVDNKLEHMVGLQIFSDKNCFRALGQNDVPLSRSILLY